MIDDRPDKDSAASAQPLSSLQARQPSGQGLPRSPIASDSAAVAQTGWFLSDGEHSAGPGTLDELKAVLRQEPDPGKFQVWHRGFEDWKPVADVLELAECSRPVPVPPIAKLQRTVKHKAPLQEHVIVVGSSWLERVGKHEEPRQAKLSPERIKLLNEYGGLAARNELARRAKYDSNSARVFNELKAAERAKPLTPAAKAWTILFIGLVALVVIIASRGGGRNTSSPPCADYEKGTAAYLNCILELSQSAIQRQQESDYYHKNLFP
jgi:hypothetical protein